MIPAQFDYVRPGSIAEACQELGSDEDAKVLAGGQSLLPFLRLRLAYPSKLVDLGRLADLKGVHDRGDHVYIGAMATHDEVMRSPVVTAGCPLLALAAAQVADPAIRHRGTFGGSLAHADPAGDLPAVALALDAVFVAASAGGEREIPAAEFFVDYLESSLRQGEILAGVRVPKLGEGWGFHYEKFHRTAQAWAIVGVAAAVRRSNGSIAEARIGLTNMGPTPLRAHAVETALQGVELGDQVRQACAEAAADTAPPADLHAQPDYRRHLAKVLTDRAVRAAAGAP
ncbi:FAD binding domain-containing protein [Nonomuraea gerenzanensis]|uniref:Carbon monoxide dehydrogenase medium chain n=1 Tax=Nonomuraea gerenzanensis TaxID=93944 RepID=A0A1M4E015_9ACTN|nr:xanthine dehydrogenase family protein subunit M [Nonomuraea gerenzanensis]UBU14444.1 xanthine dehydrogenase family protein subunit M [Nonomuraea gerenzanensis]SBO92159.1 Carbon monoxide dehydrogenase medium chain [Nonomuraea gerenzanensis]